MVSKKRSNKVFSSLVFLVSVALALTLFASFASAQLDPSTDNYYVGDPAQCAKEAGASSCKPSNFCGTSTTQCFPTADLANDTLDPSSDTKSYDNSFNIRDSNNGPGYVVNCFSDDGGSNEPFCDNNGNYWCQTNSTCDGWNRKTKCLAGKFAYESNSAECTTTCRDGYISCSGNSSKDTISGTEDCEVDVSDTSTGARGPADDNDPGWTANGGLFGYNAKEAVYNTNSCGSTCPDGWADYNNSLKDGCEINVGASCTTSGGVSGTIDSNGNCVPGKENFTTGEKEVYSTNSTQSAMLWFQNVNSDGDLINATNSIGESWRINNDSCIVLKDNTTICDESDIGGNGSKWNLSGNYLYNNSGDLDLNETKLNSTIDDRDDFEANTEKSGSGTYLYNNSDSILLNGTQLNDTIDSRDDLGGFGGVSGAYLYNNSGDIDFNETLLNSTIDVKIDDSAFTSITGNYLLNSSGVLDFNETYLNNTIDSRSSGSGSSFWNLSSGNLLPENTDYNVSIGERDYSNSPLDVIGQSGNLSTVPNTGTVTPTATFVNNDSNWINLVAPERESANSNFILFSNRTEIKSLIGQSNSEDALLLQNGGLYDRIVLDSNGSVGIGTNTPKSKLSVNGTTNFLNNTIMNISQINTGNATINLTYYNLTETSTSTSTQSVTTPATSSLSDFNEGAYELSSASRDANSGDLGIGYRNGSNSDIGFDGLWRFDKDIPPSKNVTNYGYVGKLFNSTANFGYDPTTSGVFSTDSYDFDPNNNGGSVKVNLRYPIANPNDNSNDELKQYTLSGWIWHDNWGNNLEETWLSANEANGNRISLSKEGQNLTFSAQGIQGPNRLSHDVSGQTGWLHYAVTYDQDQGTAQLFVNGEQADITSMTAPIKRNGSLVIGKEMSSPDYNWTGRIDEVILDSQSYTESVVSDSLYFTGNTQTVAGGSFRFVGRYGSPINNTNSSNWQTLTVNSTVRTNTKVNVTFQSLDSSGNPIDSETFSLSGSQQNFDLSTLADSYNSSLIFYGSSSVPSETWEVESYSVSYKENSVTTTTNSSINPQYVFENSDVEINGLLNVTGNVTSQTDFCIQEGKCLSDSGSGRWDLSSNDLYLEDTNYNVSIGGTDASSKLDVEGDAEVSGEINPERNTSFGKGTQIKTDQTHCLDGSTCNHYIKYNGSATIIQ